MAQVIKLKRTAIQGKTPTTTNLDLGELAINTYDGRIFFEKDVNGFLSIQEIITTDSDATGSLNINGSITSSYFVGDGSSLTNISASSVDFNDITAKPTLISGSEQVNVTQTILYSSLAKTGSNTFVGPQLILDETLGQNYSLTVGANSTGDRFHVTTNNTAGSGIVLTSKNSNNTSDTKLSFSGSSFEFGGGDVNILGNLTLGGNITIGDATTDVVTVTAGFSGSLIPDSGSTYDLGSSAKPWNELHANTLYGDGSNITNITVDAAATVSYTFTNESIITVSHNFNTRNILVAVYDNQNNQVLPQNVNTSNLDQVVITLSSAQSGVVVVAKGGHILSGSADDSNKLGGKLPSAYATTGSNQFQDNQEITGSLNVSGGITGSVSYTNLTDLPTLISGSTQITDGSNIVSGSTQITDGSGLLSSSNEDFNTFSSSIDLRTDSLESFSSSFDTAINLDSTNVTILGDLTVQGTTTTINTSTFNVEDNIIELNYGGSATEGGIFVKDSTGGSTTSGSLLWDATNDYWKAGTSGSESEIITTSNIVTNLPTGTISGSEQLPSGTVSGSTQITNGSGLLSSSNEDFSTFSSSVDNRLDQLETDSGSQDSRLDNLESFTSSLSTTESTYSGSFSGSFVGDGSGLTGIQVDQIASVTASFSEQSTINVSHNFGTYNVIVSTYDSNYNQLIPQTVSLTDTNTVQVVLSSAHSGHVVVAKGGHILDTSELTSYREDVSGASSYAITHSLDESYPFVQAWNTSTSMIEQPLSVESNSANVITVSFAGTFDGKIIVKK